MTDAKDNRSMIQKEISQVGTFAPDDPTMGNKGGGRPKILYVLHHWGGGTEKHALDLARTMSRDFAVYIMKPFSEGYVVETLPEDGKNQFVFITDFRWDASTIRSIEYSNVFEKVVRLFDIDLIHVQHLIGNTLDIFDIAEKHSIPVVVTLHDYYAICPRINPIDSRCFMGCSDCASCMRLMGLEDGFIEEWRGAFSKALFLSDLIIAPDGSVFDAINKFFELDRSRQRVIEHGYDSDIIALGKKNRTIKDISGLSEINIGFIGNLLLHKGAEIFYDLSTRSYAKTVNWIHVGEPSLLHQAETRNVKATGWYKGPEELMEILREHKIHLTLLPALWPETFSYTLSESWIAGIPVIVSDLGAPRDRVLNARGGWVASPDAESFKRRIDHVIASPEEYIDVQENIQKIEMPTLEESRDAYLRAYGELNLDSSSRGAASVSQEPGGVADEFARLSERHLNDLALFSQEKSLLEHDRLVLEKEKSALEREKYVLEQHKLNLERGIRDLTDQSERLVDQVRDMVAQLVEKDYRIISGESRISQLEGDLARSDARCRELEAEICAMRQSLTFKLTARFQEGVVEKAMPQNTRRRTIYDSAIRASRQLAGGKKS